MDQNQNIYCPKTSLQFLDELDNKIFGTVWGVADSDCLLNWTRYLALLVVKNVAV